MNIETVSFSELMRGKGIDVASKRLLVTNFRGTKQETDFTEPANCDGFGRIRHFRRATSPGWPENPLPIDPASARLGLPKGDLIRAQVFQNAVCNWRCWYCFVPFELLAGNRKHSFWMSAGDLLDLYQNESNAPQVIDLSGGQPDLTPEWVPWMMTELERRNLHSSLYLWSDDNLSNDYFWRFLPRSEIRRVANYKNYGKVCCFKGFDPDSFSFNTKAAPEIFQQQLQLFGRYLELGIDLYGYATFTARTDEDVESKMTQFVDSLQHLSPKLPLRVIPLEIAPFTPVHGRMEADHHRALEVQQVAIQCWNRELDARFSTTERRMPINDIRL